LERVRIAVAYARWEGLGLISDQIIELLETGGRFETVYGAGNGVTTPDALYAGLVLQTRFPGKTYSGFVEDEYANATFHPKFYEFRYNTETIVIIGSANLTGGGLCRNCEVGISISFARGAPAEQEWDNYWQGVLAKAKEVSAPAIRKLAARPGSGREGTDEAGGSKAGKPYLKQTKPSPLFREVLKLKKLPKKDRENLLGDMSALSQKPKRLYLQVFKRETGGGGGKPGNAVQFPVATLGAFFGIERDEAQSVIIDFADQTITPRFMHLSNDTHRLRIPPILGVERPAILILDRIGTHHYKGRFAKNYLKTLNSKCTEQRTPSSRRWGIQK
jgi:HKD family nuclease